MTLLDIPLAVLGLVLVAVAVRAVLGPSKADRATAADLAFFVFLAMAALIGARMEEPAAFDVVLIGTLTGFVSAVWLARLITRGK